MNTDERQIRQDRIDKTIEAILARGEADPDGWDAVLAELSHDPDFFWVAETLLGDNVLMRNGLEQTRARLAEQVADAEYREARKQLQNGQRPLQAYGFDAHHRERLLRLGAFNGQLKILGPILPLEDLVYPGLFLKSLLNKSVKHTAEFELFWPKTIDLLTPSEWQKHGKSLFHTATVWDTPAFLEDVLKHLPDSLLPKPLPRQHWTQQTLLDAWTEGHHVAVDWMIERLDLANPLKPWADDLIALGKNDLLDRYLAHHHRGDLPTWITPLLPLLPETQARDRAQTREAQLSAEAPQQRRPRQRS